MHNDMLKMRRCSRALGSKYKEQLNSPFISNDQEGIASIYEEIKGVLVGSESKFVVSTGHPVQALDSDGLKVPSKSRACVLC